MREKGKQEYKYVTFVTECVEGEEKRSLFVVRHIGSPSNNRRFSSKNYDGLV